jgi:xanthine/CO dehydrogenase XdhC/CoxF family maturation factor
VANDAHACRRGKVTETFEEVARAALNEGNALPWNTNGKHCNGRYKLLLENFRRADRARALASGIEEEIGERYQKLAGIQSAVNEKKSVADRARGIC